MGGCGRTGQELNDANFAKPLPLIGLYVAGASLVCAFAMLLDALNGFRKHKFWFPCRWFPLNATTLTLVGIATKFPVDLNTSMPGRFDQLSKLTGTILICTVTANFMPSLGNMDRSEIASNVVAMGILVITVIVNICIQMGTGVIYVFWTEHIIVMGFMLVLLAILTSSALPVTTTKHLLGQQFDDKYGDVPEGYDVDSLKKKVQMYWLMAHTGSPQYVMGRSATCIASGSFCLLAAAVLCLAFVRSLALGSMFCSGVSDYGWSTTAVFYVQAAAVLVGTVAPAYRWFNAISFRKVEISSWSCREEFHVEEYWIKMLKDRIDQPLPFNNGRRRWRNMEYRAKSLILAVLIKMQQGMVLLCKLVRLLSVAFFSWLPYLKRTTAHRPMTDVEVGTLKEFVLRLEGEEDLVDVITRSEQIDVEKWIQRGKDDKPTSLIELLTLDSSRTQGGFGGLQALDRSRTEPLVPVEEEPRNCWALPIVTLVSIALALPNVSWTEKKSLMKKVYQGLRYVRFVEVYLDGQGLVFAREVADTLWKSVEIYGRWFEVDLIELGNTIERRNRPHPSQSISRLVVQNLEEIGRLRFNRWSSQQQNMRNHLQWPGEILAAYCLYKVAAGILADTDDNLFPLIQRTISDTIRACLTNTARAIHLCCISSNIEVREESVRYAACLLGETEDDILPILQEQEAEFQLDENQRAYIDDWFSVWTSAPTSQV